MVVLVTDLWNVKPNGVDGGVMLIFEALEPDLFKQTVGSESAGEAELNWKKEKKNIYIKKFNVKWPTFIIK